MTRPITIALTVIIASIQVYSLQGQINDHQIDSIFHQGIEHMEQYDYKSAAASFYTCQREENDNPIYHYYLGLVYERLGNIQDARIFYRKAHSLDSNNATYKMALGNIELQRQDYHSAKEYFHSLIRLDSTNSYYYKELGKTCFYANDIPCAIHSLQYCLYYNNRDLEATGMLSQIYYENQDYEICLDWVRKGLLLDAQNPKFLNLKLKSEIKNEAYNEAVATGEFMLEIGDSSFQTLKYYGIALCKTGQYKKSIDILLPLVEVAEDEGIHYFLSESYAAMDEVMKSIEHLESAAYRFGIGPMVWRYFRTLSRMYEETGQLKQALLYMERAYDLNSEPLLLFQIARLTDVYYKDKRMALNRYDQYLATEDRLYREYASERMLEIKQYIHQSKVK